MLYKRRRNMSAHTTQSSDVWGVAPVIKSAANERCTGCIEGTLNRATEQS